MHRTWITNYLHPNSINFVILLGLFTFSICFYVAHYYLKNDLLSLIFVGCIIIFLLAVFINIQQIAFYVFIIFILMNATFSNFVPEMVGYLTKEVLLFLIFSLWFTNKFVSGKTTINYSNFGKLEFVLVIFLLFTFLESFRHTSLAVGFFGFRSVALYAPVYFLTAAFIKNKDDVVNVMRIFFISVWLIAIVGIVQYFMASVMMEKMGFTFGDVAYRTTAGHIKASATLGNASAFGTLIVFFLLIFISIKIVQSRNTEYSINEKIVNIVFPITLILALIFSFSRISQISFIFSFLTLGLLIRKKVFRYVFFGSVIIISVNLFLDNFFFDYLSSTIGLGQNQQGTNSALERLSIIKNSISKYVTYKPFLGWGLGTTGAPSLRNINIAPMGYLVMDNYYLKMLVESGLIGTTLFLALIIGAITRGINSYRIISDSYLKGLSLGITLGLIALSFINVASTVLEMPSINIYFWILLGLLSLLRTIDVKNRNYSLKMP